MTFEDLARSIAGSLTWFATTSDAELAAMLGLPWPLETATLAVHFSMLDTDE